MGLTTSPRRFLFLLSQKCALAPFLRRKLLDLNTGSVLTEDLTDSRPLHPPIYQSMEKGREVEKKAEMKKLWSCNWTIGVQQQQRRPPTNFLEGPKAKMETGNKTLKSLKN